MVAAARAECDREMMRFIVGHLYFNRQSAGA